MTATTTTGARRGRRAALVLAGLVAFLAVFVVVDQSYNRAVGASFPPVGESAWRATLYGVVSRLHLILPLVVLLLWRPRRLGWQLGGTVRRWRLLVLLLALNCGLVGGFLLLNGGSTPYSGDQWLVTEVVVTAPTSSSPSPARSWRSRC